MDRPAASRVNWVLPVSAVATLLILALTLFVYTPYAEFPLLFVVMPLICIALLVVLVIAIVKKRKLLQGSTVLTLAAVIVVSFAILKLQDPIRESLRWLLWSNRFKAEVLASPAPRPGELRHMEWEATGFAGIANNTIYLVMDPSDALHLAAQTGSSGKYPGIPCEVLRVRRLEARWYSVRFYTDEAWGEQNRLDCRGRSRQ
jgi:hypothetical protein